MLRPQRRGVVPLPSLPCVSCTGAHSRFPAAARQGCAAWRPRRGRPTSVDPKVCPAPCGGAGDRGLGMGDVGECSPWPAWRRDPSGLPFLACRGDPHGRGDRRRTLSGAHPPAGRRGGAGGPRDIGGVAVGVSVAPQAGRHAGRVRRAPGGATTESWLEDHGEAGPQEVGAALGRAGLVAPDVCPVRPSLSLPPGRRAPSAGRCREPLARGESAWAAGALQPGPDAQEKPRPALLHGSARRPPAASPPSDGACAGGASAGAGELQVISRLLRPPSVGTASGRRVMVVGGPKR